MASNKAVRKAIENAEIDMEAFEDEYTYIGIRVQEETFGLKVGDKVIHNSRVWVDGEETEEELDGVSATMCSAMARTDNEYAGQYILILGDNKMSEYGEDDGEIVLYCPTVLAILKVED